MKKKAVLAAAVGTAICVASHANADFNVEITTVNQETGYTEVVEFFNHEFGTSESMDGFGNPDGLFPIHLTSGQSALSDWQFQMVIDYTDYDLGFFGIAGKTDAIIDINNPAYAGVVDAIVLDANSNPVGNISFTDNSITMSTVALALQMGGEIATVHWNVPAPGALALLGIAGLIGVPRRRS